MTRPAAVLEKMIEELERQKNYRPPYCRPSTEGFRVNDISRRKALAQQIKGLRGELERARKKEQEAESPQVSRVDGE